MNLKFNFMKTRKPFEVFETKEYSQFKKIDYNRAISRGNVKKIMKSIIEYGLIVPIVVSEDGYIIDGQHRLEALRELQMPVWYVVSQNIKSDIVQEVNGVRKGWTINDWIQCHAKKGNLDYQSLLLQIEAWSDKFTLSSVCDAFYKYNTQVSRSIRKGTYQCDVEFGTEVLNNCIKASEVIEEKAFKGKFVRAMKYVMTRNGDRFNIDRLVEKAKVKKIHIYNNEYDIASDIIEAYNHKLKSSEIKIK